MFYKSNDKVLRGIMEEQHRKAGELLLNELKTVNETAIYLTRKISPAFWYAIDENVQKFIADNNWEGTCNLESDKGLWLAPGSWKFNETWQLWFESATTAEGGVDSHLATITGVGTQAGEWGFESYINLSAFGESAHVAAKIKDLDNKYVIKMRAEGFQYRGKGNFFIPVKVDLCLLSRAWATMGDFPMEDAAFDNLRDVLKKLRSAASIMDEFIAELSAVSGCDTRKEN